MTVPPRGRIGWKDLALSLAALFYSLPAWAYPFGNDQALHWYLGRRWLDGELPFVSGISSKPIGIFAVHMLSTGLLGPGSWPVRVTEALSVICVGFIAAAAAHTRPGPMQDGERGLGALVFSATYYTFLDYWDTAHPELWEGGLALAAYAVAARPRSPFLRDAGTGALCGAAFMFKFPAALPALGAAAFCGLHAMNERPAEQNPVVALVLAAARYLLGVGAVFALCVLPHAWGGQLGPMWEILHDFILVYAEQAQPRAGLPGWLRIERAGSLLVLTFALVCVAVALCRERGCREGLDRSVVLQSGAVLAAGSVALQDRYFDYHWGVLLPFLAALSLFGISQLCFAHEPPNRRMPVLAVLAVAALFFATPRWATPRDHSYLRHTTSVIAYLRGKLSRQQYVEPFRGRNRLDAVYGFERVAARIRAAARPGDTLCARGFATPLYPLTGLRCTSRHIVQEIVGKGLASWPEEYRRTLEQHPPTFIVTFVDRPADLTYLTGRGYRRLATEGAFAIFTRRAI